MPEAGAFAQLRMKQADLREQVREDESQGKLSYC